ncbi:organic cation transporter protein-like [Tubulanus polymorphus]|uniref:organic cation transporter protein-like n=1 Tax=Tubulanus polymorphus TaxID=672921 RepID=UPI003DA6BB33
MDLENVLRKLGKYGIWQIGVYVMWAFAFNIPYVFNALALVFIGSRPISYHCTVGENETFLLEGNGKPSMCSMYRNSSFDNTTVSCQNGWTYANHEEFGSTIVTEFDLVCDKSYLSELSQTLYVMGETIGSILITPLADVYGRKRVHLICQFFLAACTVIQSFSVNYIMFVLLRVANGMFLSGVVLTAIVAAIEMFPMEMRTLAGQLFFVWWAGAMMFMDLLAYFIRDWRHLQLALGLIPFTSMIGFWLCPESVPWLLANGKVEKAEKIVKQAAKLNRVELPEHPFHQSIVTEEKEPEPEPEPEPKDNEPKIQKVKPCALASEDARNCFMLISHPLLRRIFLIMLSLWFVNNIVYYGITFMSPSLTDSKYLNFFLSALAELPACLTCILTLERFGRRKPLCFFHCLAGGALLILIFVPDKTADGTSLMWLIMTLTFIAKFAITGSFNALIQFTMEVYPTNQRNTGLGLSSMTGRMSGMIAPFTIPLVKMMPWVPFFLFAVMSITVGIAAMLLPETLYYPLPQTVEEMETWDVPTVNGLINSCLCRDKKTHKKNNPEQMPMTKDVSYV